MAHVSRAAARRSSRALLLSILFAAAAGTVRGGPAAAGHDLLETDTAATLEDLVLMPAFFGPGSDPFVGRVQLRGVPLDSFDPDGPGPLPTFSDLWPTDTIVRRLADANPPFPATIPIEIVELHLVSASPITVTYNGGMNPQQWNLRVEVHVNPVTGAVDPPQPTGSMTIRHEYPDGGTFDSLLPVKPLLTFTQVGGPGVVGPFVAGATLNLSVTGESWSHAANPLIFPADGQFVIEVPGLTSNFFPGCVCATCQPPREPAVCYSVDGGLSSPARNGAPLTPLPNPAEGLIVPDPRHAVPNDVYALGWSPGGNAYETEGEIFQSAGDPLGAPPNVSNVDRMSSALGIGPAPGGPPFLGPFSPNPGAPAPAPPPGALGTFGLKSGDNVDALSFGRDSGDVLLFSVDPATAGVPGTHVRIHAVTSPLGAAAALPFPTNPGGGNPGNEAAGDVFKSLPLAPFGSYIPLHYATGNYLTPATVAANELAIDEFLLGLQAPALNGSALGAPEDDLDGLELSDAGDPIFGVDLIDNGTGIGPPDGVPDRFVFFSLDTASVSIAPALFDPDDVLLVPPGGFGFGLFADGASDIGLLVGDDIDALAVSDVTIPGGPPGVLDPGLDEALFSLHPGSPSVLLGPDGIAATGDEVSAADIFYTSFTGGNVLYASAAALGLLASDNVNAIDIQPKDIPPPGGGGGGGSKKKLSKEDEQRARHGIRVAQKRRCNMNTSGTFQVTIFGFPSTVVNASGPTSGVRTSTTFDPATLQTTIPTELVSMSLSGFNPTLGPVNIKAGRAFGLQPATGANLPLSPASDLPAQSFFDVVVVIDLPNLGLQLETERPFHVQTPLPIHDFPPFGADYQGNGPVLLRDQNGQPRGTLDFAVHRVRCLTNAECNDNNPCTADACVAGGSCVHTQLPDADGDGVCDLQDNCPSYPNPGQGPVLFPEPILWPDRTQFCWSTPAPIHGVVGPLAQVGVYAISAQYNDPVTLCHAAPEPAGPPGQGRYYVIEPDCPAASYQTTLGSEPGRDVSLP